MSDTTSKEAEVEGTVSAADAGWFKANEARHSEDDADAREVDVAIADVMAPEATKEANADAEGGDSEEEAKAAETGGESDASDGDGDGAEAESESNSPVYTKALEALHRGLPESMRGTIDSMSREEVLEAGLSMAYSQAEQDRVGSELGILKKGSDLQSKEKDSGDVDAGTLEPRSEFDPLKELEPFDLEQNPEDLPEALAHVLKAAVKHTEEGVRAEMQRGGSDELSKLQKQFDGYKIDQVGRQLEGRFPQLRDAGSMAEVQKMMRQIAPGMEYAEGSSDHAQTVERMELACKLTLGKQANQPGKKDPGKRNQPPRPSRKPASNTGKKTTQKEKDFAFFKTWEETGGNTEAAKRAYRGN